MMLIASDKVISTILKHDTKVTSYKIALLRAINDVVLTYPDLRTYQSDVAVPLKLLAEFWIAYYWPYVDLDDPIPQGQRAQRQGQTQLADPVARIVERLRRARLVCSDETSARLNGQNQWEWVFQNGQVCLHVIRPSRGKAVIDETMAGHRPQVWVSDLFSAQKAHPAQQWQVCLAHQLRDCQYAIDAGDDLFAPRMKRLLLRAIAVNRRRQTLAESTLGQYHSRLRGSLREVLNLKPTSPEGQRLLRRYQTIREHLLLFLDDETVPPTNNSSEQALRWSVVFRKVIHGFRSNWGAQLFAQVRSLVNTARRQGISAFEAISRALTSPHADWLLS